MITVNGKVYDGVAVKPDLDEALEHYGVKGMKWRKHLKNAASKVSGAAKKVKWKLKNKKYDVVTGLTKKSKTAKTIHSVKNLMGDVAKNVTRDQKEARRNWYMKEYQRKKSGRYKRLDKFPVGYKNSMKNN